MAQSAPCPSCGSVVGPNAGEGSCPRCLINLALSPEESPALGDFRLGSGRFFGDYEVGRQLGSGGMGVVYEATRLSDGQHVALKLLRDYCGASPAQLRRFTLEAQTVARLDHPNIVRVHEVGEWEGHPFLSMEYVEGLSLGELIGRAKCGSLDERPLPLNLEAQRQWARFMVKTTRAVEHAHLRGVLHRDLKPANILIDARDEPRLTDFGLAKILAPSRDEQTRTSLTATGDAPGTPGFMSPEQVRGGRVTEAADIYGLGAVLYCRLTGRAPFQAATPLELFRQVIETTPVRPSQLHPGLHRDLETICLKCLEKDPRHRYATAGALAEDLERFASGQPIAGRRPTPWRRAGQWMRRNPAGMWVITSLALGLAGALVLLKTVNDQRREIELDRDQTFDEGMQKVSQIWRDPATDAVTISARELAILAGRSPATVRGAQRQLTLAVRADDGPSSMAQRYAHLLAGFQEFLLQDPGHKIAFQLRLVKRLGTEPGSVLSSEVDLMVLSASDLYRSLGADEACEIIGLTGGLREGVIFSRANAGILDIGGLRGRSVLFPDPGNSLTLLAKAEFVRVGLRAPDLRGATISDQGPELGNPVVSTAETIAGVLRGQADAGICPQGQFERYKHQGLVALHVFPDAPKVLAVRRELDPVLMNALRRAVASPRLKQSWPDSSFVPVGPDESAPNRARLATVREAVRGGRLFDAQK